MRPGDPAPRGLGTDTVPGDGTGVGLALVEGGWWLDGERFAHPALRHVRVGPPRVNLRPRRDHGTRMAGIVLASSPTLRGIAPGAGPVHLLGSFAAPGVEDLAGALDRARLLLRPGDVLLLEAQVEDPVDGRLLPAEAHPDVADAVTALTRAGIGVVAPAGNGGVHLDALQVPAGVDRRPFDPRHPSFRDTGAILVAAGVWRHGWVRRRGPGDLGSNHGSRVDAFAWGEGVPVPSYRHPPGADPAPIEDLAGETSAAAALVAGVVLRLQAAAKARGRVLDPATVRGWLRETGSPGESGMGRMPDLVALLALMDAPAQ